MDVVSKARLDSMSRDSEIVDADAAVDAPE